MSKNIALLLSRKLSTINQFSYYAYFVDDYRGKYGFYTWYIPR